MATEKILNTRIQLKYDTLENWNKSTFKLKAGELAVVTLGENKDNSSAGTVNQHPVLFKVGTGNHTFAELPFASALAADVYSWAKAKEVKRSNKTLQFIGSDNTAICTVDFDYITDNEAQTKINDALKSYYTKTDADAKFAPIGIDTGVHAVSLASGTNNGTVKLTVDSTVTDNIAVTGLKDAAYATVASLNATAKGYADDVEDKLPTSADYGVLSVTAGDNITIGGTAQNPTIAVTANKFDAYGAAAQALADAKAYADAKPHENTAHSHSAGAGLTVTGDGGIAGDVKYALNVAFELTADKTIKLYDKNDSDKKALATLDATDFIADGMLASVTADQDKNELVFQWNTDAGITETKIALDAIADIYTGTTGDEVNISVNNKNEISASLNSGVATKIANGATAHGWGNHANAGYAKAADLGSLAIKDAITESDISGTIGTSKITNFATDVAAVKVSNATNADNAADASKLGGQAPTYYATAASVTNITKDNGTIDTKIADYNTSKNFGDIITHNVAEFATAAQGGKADSALQSITTTANNGLKVTNKNQIDIDDSVVFVFNCGSSTKLVD